MTDQPDPASAIALALTGERVATTGMATLVDDLASAGFDAGRLAAIRADAQHGQRPWPFPVPIEERRRIGFARFDAAIAGARRDLGLDGLTATPAARRPLNRDEQRLVQDRPPHWG